MFRKLTPRCSFAPPALRQITERIRSKSDGINLSQGTCQLPIPEILLQAITEGIRRGYNLYSSAEGLPELRIAVASKLNNHNKIPCDPSNVIITAGSTAAFEAFCNSFLLGPDDEVVIFAPAYPYHVDKLIERGVKIRKIWLNGPQWQFDPNDLTTHITAKTKFVLLCNPSNPTGKVFNIAELQAIANRCVETDTLCVTDEVYEYIFFDENRHISMASLPSMVDRTVTMGSYSKTFAITGWRIGYLSCPPSLYASVRSTWDHQAVCTQVPGQYAVAKAIESLPFEYYEKRRIEYSRKRDLLYAALGDSGFRPFLPQGAYYIVARTTERFPHLTSEEVADILVEELRIGSVPASDFLGREVLNKPSESNILRFNFAVHDSVLEDAALRLRGL